MLVHLVDCYGRCFLCQGKQCGLPEGKPVPHADVAMLGSQAISGMTEKKRCLRVLAEAQPTGLDP